MGADHGREDQELFQTLRTSLRSGEPLGFLAVMSGFLEVTALRSRDPFALEKHRAGLDDLVESFVGTPYAETTAALTVIKALVADEVLAARIGRELELHRTYGSLRVGDPGLLLSERRRALVEDRDRALAKD